MRKVLAVMGLLTIFGFGSGAAQQADKTEAAQMCLLKVSGMHCGARGARVEKIAKTMDGVTSAKVSQPKGTAEITYDPAKTTPEAVAKIITDKAGFTAEVRKQNQKKN